MRDGHYKCGLGILCWGHISYAIGRRLLEYTVVVEKTLVLVGIYINEIFICLKGC
jgi:hypothetical protein